ncbi:type VI secretion system Vgr family protein [Prevotella sp. 10(H)]|uniref:type VI secretion system Vgr family protein n=1 Tax=Prevotella sp. 10(H) TaxID=1158294 RepID=UPI0004A72FB5|nr:phage baseplate assembly protein V [Prevotella sp. 10(H)]
MATQNLLDEKHITNAIVYIEGEEVNKVSLYLNQEFGHHHTFRVILDYDIIKKNFLGNPTDQINLIGKTLDIELQQGNERGKAYEFRGIINDVHMEGREGKHGYLVICGYSPTYLLERGKRLDIFADMGLQEVFEEVTDGVQGSALSKVNSPVYNVPLNFLMQYNESDWEFLQRLSAISGETLFYTGRDLVFGQYKDWAATNVMYDKELTHIQFGSRLLANKFTNYQYLPEKDETLIQESPDKIENSNEYVDLAAQKAKTMVKDRPVLIPPSLEVEDKGALNDMAERRKASTAARTVYIKGIAKTCDPRIGRLITISMPQGMSEFGDLGTYRVVKVTHTIDENHHYSCEFEAIPSSLKFFPVQEIKMPVASSLLGTVINNADPEGQGRVRVEFPFAKDRVSATWMRVMTPHAGSSDIVNKNRGIVFIPEEGDQVMVGFEFGDPNRPYVMGSMFHGTNGEGGGEKNFKKSIITRSGSKLEFADIEDEEKYTVILQHNDNNTVSISVEKDKGTIHIESTQDIFIKAPELIQMEAKQIIMKAELIQATAEDKIEMVAQSMLHAESGDKVEILGATVAQESTGEFTLKGETVSMKASSKMNIDGGSKMNVKAGNIKMNQ